MVYAFLEDVLGAPKIFTKAEIVGGTSGSRTDGVHLLKLNAGGNDKYQLVLAASDITGDIKNAVDSVIQRLDDIADVTGNERKMVDRAILSSSFDADTTSYLKKYTNTIKGGNRKTRHFVWNIYRIFAWIRSFAI